VLAKYGVNCLKAFLKHQITKHYNIIFHCNLWVNLSIGLLSCLVLGLNKALTSILAGIGVIGLALGFAFQDIAANFFSGIILAFNRPLKLGNHRNKGYNGHSN
jgi:small conductance mechanosensitive channel